MLRVEIRGGAAADEAATTLRLLDVEARCAFTRGPDDGGNTHAALVIGAGGDDVDVPLDGDVGALWRHRLGPWAAAMCGAPTASAPAVLHPHDRTWAAAAARRLRRLRQALRTIDDDCAYEHIGSTAVPGLAAKPVLDLQVVTPALPPAPLLDGLLHDVGYLPVQGSRPDSPGVYRDAVRGSEPAPDEVWVKRLFFSPDPAQPVILHLRLAASPFGRHTVWFRDWLIAHPAERERYQQVKAELAAAHAQDADYDDYTRGKTAYLDEVQQRFEAWGRSHVVSGSASRVTRIH